MNNKQKAKQLSAQVEALRKFLKDTNDFMQDIYDFTGSFPAVVRVDEVLPVLLEIINHQPSCEGGGCFYPRHDGEGNYIGEENVDPIGVIQAMSTLASALITKLEAMK